MHPRRIQLHVCHQKACDDRLTWSTYYLFCRLNGNVCVQVTKITCIDNTANLEKMGGGFRKTVYKMCFKDLSLIITNH